MSMKQEHADFEEWALKERIAYRDEKHGVCFYNGERNLYWIGYQAGRAALQSQDREDVIALRKALQALEAIADEMTVGDRFTNAGPQPAEPDTSETLWCLHIQGPDDVYSAPSKAYAEVAADLHNARFDKETERTGVMCKAVVAPWPYSPDLHAQDVGGFVEDWLMPQPVEPCDVLPSEAVFAFAAWLTCRTETASFASHLDAAPAAQLVSLFIDSQGWADPRDDYISRLKPYPVEQAASASDPVKVRPETTSEHIARDIREGRFPNKSERQMIPAEPDGTLIDEGTKSADPVVKESLTVAEPVKVPQHLIERLQRHCENKSNSAFARSSMREALQYLTAEPEKVPSDDEVLEAMRLSLDEGDGGYVCDMSPMHVIASGRALLARYGQPVEPEGWQLVPKEPTKEMLINAMEASLLGRPSPDDDSYVRSIVSAWCEAAPKFGEEE